MNRTFIALVALGALVASGRAADARAEANDDRPAAPRSIGELKKRVAEVLAEEHIPGVGIVLVTRDGGVEWAGGVGKADVGRGIDVTADTLFRVGSITKCFVALAVVRLAEEGKLALDARLKDIAPEIAFQNPWERSHPVTVAHLLEHTAGFDDTRPMEIFATRGDQPLRAVLAVDPRGRVSRWPPGTRYSYSNPGYTILGYLIEKVTSRAYEDYVRDTLLVPLGMTHADLRRTPAVDARLARGYVDSAPTPVEYAFELHRPAAQMHASPADLAHLVELWLGRGAADGKPLFSPDTIASMERPRTLPPSGLLGYGFANDADVVNGWVVHGHTGGLDGFSSYAMYIPQRGVGWVLLMNTSAAGNGPQRLNALIVQYLTRGASPPAPPTGAALPEDALRAYAGYYEFADSQQEALAGVDSLFLGRTIFIERGQLWGQDFLDAPFRLVPTGVPGGFRGEHDAVTTVLFTHRDEGDVMLTGAYRVKTSPWKVRLLRGLVFGAFAVMASSLLFALVWGPRWLLRRHFRSRARAMATRVSALVASILGLTSIGLLARGFSARDFVPLKNALTVSLFVVPSAFALASAVALVLGLRSFVRRDQAPRAVRLHALLVALSSCAMVSWMAYWGWIGVRLWDY